MHAENFHKIYRKSSVKRVVDVKGKARILSYSAATITFIIFFNRAAVSNEIENPIMSAIAAQMKNE